jgi:hypothetical protein
LLPVICLAPILLGGLAGHATRGAPAQAIPLVSEFSGRWNGAGTLRLQGDRRERITCRATYSPSGASGMLQTLRCASSRYNFDFKSNLRIDGTRVSGQWQDDANGRSGILAGSVRGKSIAVNISGAGFSASMVVRVDACSQSISMRPRSHEIEQVALRLKKGGC